MNRTFYAESIKDIVLLIARILMVLLFAELGAGIAIAAGILTRPIAVLLALYTFATALLGHPYWSMSGMDRVGAEINFFKNISIIAGLLLLYLTGAGKYSIDDKLNLR